MTGPTIDPGDVEPARTPRDEEDSYVHVVPNGRGFRLSKVIAARYALSTDKYDSDAVLDETARRLNDDLGIVSAV